MSPGLVNQLLETVHKLWPVDPGLEITLEANPNSIEQQKFQDFRSAGINRISVGVQALNDQDLRFLGRAHKAQEALQALDVARRIFDRYSFDLIYARPGQTLEGWEQELRQALTLAKGHLSLYQLTIEPQTAFHTAYARGDWILPCEDTQAELYTLTGQIMGEAGYEAYEVSNYAQPAQACGHNLVYWRYEDYLGIGPGAHGRLTCGDGKHALRNFKAPETWLNHVTEHGWGLQEDLALDPLDQVKEALLMGLRLQEGVSLDLLRTISPKALTILDPLIANLLAEGYVQSTPTHLRIAPSYVLVSNTIVEKLSNSLPETL
jgi:oxygen-independent coproporphyrinogen-3 oxidase